MQSGKKYEELKNVHKVSRIIMLGYVEWNKELKNVHNISRIIMLG